MASLIPKIVTQKPQPSLWVMGTFIGIERGLDFCLAIFLILMILLLNMYTVPLSRNILVHAGVFTVFFLSSSTALLLRTLFGLKNVTAVDTGLMAVSSICVWAWFFLLSPKGEETRIRPWWFAPQQEERILDHLDALNASLLKLTGK